MNINRILIFSAPIFLILIAVPGYGDGLFLFGNNGHYSNRNTPSNYYRYPAQRRLIGPVTSFNNAYGPVTSFGLRNYTPHKNSDLYYRRDSSYHNNFNRYLHDKSVKKQRNQDNWMRFGYTIDKKTGNHDYKREYKDGYGDTQRSNAKIFVYDD